MGEDGPCGGHRIWPCKIEDTYIVHTVCRYWYIFIYTHKVDNDGGRGSVDQALYCVVSTQYPPTWRVLSLVSVSRDVPWAESAGGCGG